MCPKVLGRKFVVESFGAKVLGESLVIFALGLDGRLGADLVVPLRAFGALLKLKCWVLGLGFRV